MSDPDTKRRFRGDPLAIKGAIDSAWVLHKAHLLKVGANKLQKIGMPCPGLLFLERSQGIY